MKGDEDVTVTAIVRVELEVEAGGVWGGDCSMEQVHKQATDSALHMVERVAREGRLRILPGTLAVTSIRAVAVRKAPR